ncbi:hypothetical protein [Neobacillus cucumis]|uniref:Uncharacterized protein n=1 Tax=Neobacillus cucumis TaxID=1740721 RepID=A0A2N5HES8_9BACI|nr:hypothetical protein [Neobacillus cucumis]PLS04007.1 hypothetical protein CVD27_12670 [Neobacillus cucumis]
MQEQTKKDIKEYFMKKLDNELNVLDVSIFQEIRRVMEEASSKGILRSGMTLNGIANTIIDNTINSCKDKLSLIDEFQDYLKFNIPEKQLDEIEGIFVTYYVPFLKNKAENTYVNHSKDLFGDTNLNITEQFKFDSSVQNIKIK